ncbi:glycosyl hydrolase 53 family protein, partial [Ideonella sp.]|uniref:glycosyl hydrolase 53 family protein n=1 Tax=Ideonella sp. TaxID=1929293 RepID=UPI003BB4A7FB
SAAVLRYNKPVIVMETSTGYTLPEDLTPKAMEGVKSAQRAGYPATPQGQVQLISDLSDVMNAVPQGKGLGLFWWEPAWLPLPGQGWRTGARRSAEQTLFDAQGQALPSLDAFRALVPH